MKYLSFFVSISYVIKHYIKCYLLTLYLNYFTLIVCECNSLSYICKVERGKALSQKPTKKRPAQSSLLLPDLSVCVPRGTPNVLNVIWLYGLPYLAILWICAIHVVSGLSSVEFRSVLWHIGLCLCVPWKSTDSYAMKRQMRWECLNCRSNNGLSSKGYKLAVSGV